MRSRRAPRLVATCAALALLALPLACGGGDDGAEQPPDDCTQVEGTEFVFTAKNLMWNTDCLVVPTGEEITFTMDNLDEGVEHDLRISGQGSNAQTPLVAGPAVETITFTFEYPGYYQFVCTLHATMEGDIYAQDPPR